MNYLKGLSLLLGFGCWISASTASFSKSPQGALPLKEQVPTSFYPQYLSLNQQGSLLRLAQAITVKVETPDTQGSGVIVRHRSGRYWVITNDHVALDSDRFIIKTLDGHRHWARRVSQAQFGRADLALLEFQSWRRQYPVATFSSGLKAKPGMPVVAAGFPHDRHTHPHPFKLTTGYVSEVTTKGLNGGYQLGYSNWIPKGMSGGPVMNLSGQVIAINGVHAEPLWGNPYNWDDGTVPSEQDSAKLAESSWAIPIETVMEGIPD